ncbi:MAG: LemA family protein [Alphaproteobacteria bacterium]|nr:LemA family protein [Alphaproteobacteria bacterium]
MSVVLILIFVILLFLYSLYVSLIHKKNKVKEASSGIDVQLKKRCDLIPNLLQTAAKFMTHEKDLMNEITQLRTQAINESFKNNPKQAMQVENALSEKLHLFNISVENYPDLKSNQTMVQAMSAMEETEEGIAAARRFYNSAVNDLNNAVEIFPSSLIAKGLHIETAMFFVAPERDKKPIDVKDYF